jgi:hypothetical protein
VRCPSCSRSWKVPRRDDGTVPKTARCAQYRGGCGRTVKVPRGVRASGPGAVALAPAWDPPSPPRTNRRTAEDCPGCGTPGLIASPRGTLRICDQCKTLAMPAAVAAPYERGAGSTREARSQRERDLEALQLASRKGAMRSQLDAIADDDRLTPDSRAVVEWFAEQVKAATTQARLDDLVTLYAEQKIRRRGWLSGRPAALTSGDEDDYDDEDYDDYDGEDDQADDDHPGPGTAVILATPASIAGQQHRAQPKRATWAEALAACGWRIQPVAEWSGCQVTNGAGRMCGDQQTPHSTGAGAGGGWTCSAHHGALLAALAVINQERGLQ